MTYLSNVWKYRYFWMSLVRMDLRTRYRRSMLGLGWSLLQPLAMACILFVVFQQITKVPTQQYVPHLLSGLVCWSFLVACGVQGCLSFYQSEPYIRQCPLPLAIYPLRTAIGGMFHFAMGLIVVTGLCAAFGSVPGPLAFASMLPSLVIIFVFGWAIAVIGACANVFFQDTQHLAEVGFQLWFYLTPVIYRLEDITSQHQRLGHLLAWNPALAFITLLREPLLHGIPPTGREYLYPLGLTAAAAAIASALLARLQKNLIFYM
jgi:homopolymeric O-antigen transport system permease protein